MINPMWDFVEVINNIEAIKDTYEGLLSSFSIYEVKQKKAVIQSFRNDVYELKLLEWQKDKLWEYMNGDIPYFILKSLIRQK